MLKAFFIINDVLLVLIILFFPPFLIPASAAKEDPIIITSETLTADNKSNTAVFEGFVIARTQDILIYSDKMEVAYDNSRGRISQIRAYGDVRVQKDDSAIFSEEALYIGEEDKIIFIGEPRAVDGENVITGTQIIYYLEDDRTVVKGSRVVLKNKRKQ
jgi:lipopolysaccharide export system protein LptA